MRNNPKLWLVIQSNNVELKKKKARNKIEKNKHKKLCACL